VQSIVLLLVKIYRQYFLDSRINQSTSAAAIFVVVENPHLHRQCIYPSSCEINGCDWAVYLVPGRNLFVRQTLSAEQ
jgi:hypothetical protein